MSNELPNGFNLHWTMGEYTGILTSFGPGLSCTRHMPEFMTKSPGRRWPVWANVLLLQAVLVSLALWRLFEIRQSVLGVDECLSCQAATLLQHEAGLWAIAWLTLAFATWSGRFLRILPVTVFWLLILVLTADALALGHFGLRLYLADIFKFGQQPQFVFDYLRQAAGWFWVPVILLLATGLPWLTLRVIRRGGLSTPMSLLMCVLSLLLFSLPDQSAHPLPWTYQNLLEANRLTGVDQEFSEDYLSQLLAEQPEGLVAQQCLTGLGQGSDVIIVAIESLSWYHSGLLLEDSLDAVPGLDALARDNTWWEAFHANGFTTDHGLIAMLADQLPLPAVNRYRSLNVFEGYPSGSGSIPARLAEDGYYTAFLTSGDLGFLGKGEWLINMGFDHIEGHETAEYVGAERFGFGAVNDELLYHRVLNWLQDGRPADQPVFAFVETVTTHPPFVDPATRISDETAAFRFADRALSDFVKALERAAYFENGLLIVTSDQRALTPVRAAEKDAFGAAAGARLPMVMIGGDSVLSGRQSTPAQMQDLPFSLDYLLTDMACRRPGQGNLFAAEAPGCIYQPDGNQRDIIHAFCGSDIAEIRMNGDKTRVVKGSLPDADERIRELNYQRARLGVQEANLRMVL